MSTDRKPEPRIASHPDDPTAPFADRLLLALGMWPSYVEQLGAEAVIEATVIIRSQAHRYPMVAEDYGTKHDEVERLATAIQDMAHELLQIEQHCPCGARPETPETHPHVGGCPVAAALDIWQKAFVQ